jgi:hypothetical protein
MEITRSSNNVFGRPNRVKILHVTSGARSMRVWYIVQITYRFSTEKKTIYHGIPLEIFAGGRNGVENNR